MPTYQYACTECGHRFETVQRFSDEPLQHCPVCNGRVRKVFNAVGVVFKGSGFYRTDSRSKPAEGGAGKGADKPEQAAGGSTESKGSPPASPSSSKDSASTTG